MNLTIEVPFAELESQIDDAYRRISTKVNIPGFRKGKTPKRLIDQHVGRETVLEEAINSALPDIYSNAMAENKLSPLARPNLNVTDLVDGEKVIVTATIDVRPDFSLPDFSSLDVAVDEIEVSDEDVQAQLTQLRSRFATLNQVERAATDGDVLVLDLSGTSEGQPVDEYSATALTYQLGTGGLVPGADEALAGASSGDVRTITFTAEQGANAGSEIVLNAVVTAVKEKILPAADDDFAGLASEFDTYAELEADVRKRLEFLADAQQRDQAKALILAALMAQVEVPVPEAILEAEIAQAMSRMPDGDSRRDEISKEIRQTLISNILLDRIADDIGASVTDQDVAAWLITQAPRFGVAPEQLAKALSESGEVRVAYSDILRGKALEHVVSLAKVNGKSLAQDSSASEIVAETEPRTPDQQ